MDLLIELKSIVTIQITNNISVHLQCTIKNRFASH